MSLTYAVGDIHGSLRKLRGLIAHCWEHAGEQPVTFVFLGDYIDRGPESAGVVGYLIDMQAALRERCFALMGNHEAFALGVIVHVEILVLTSVGGAIAFLRLGWSRSSHEVGEVARGLVDGGDLIDGEPDARPVARGGDAPS